MITLSNIKPAPQLRAASLAVFGLCLASLPVAAHAATPATPAPQPVQKLLAQAYGDWSYRCLATAVPGQPVVTSCFVQQQLVISNNGHTSPLLTVTLFKGASKGHTMNIITPLGIALRAGVAVSVDSEKPVLSSYTFCNNDGCVVLDAPASPITKDIHVAKIGHAKVGLMNNRPLTINFSLKGLAAALAALDSGALPHNQVSQG